MEQHTEIGYKLSKVSGVILKVGLQQMEQHTEIGYKLSKVSGGPQSRTAANGTTHRHWL